MYASGTQVSRYFYVWFLAGLLLVGSPVRAEIKEGDILLTDHFGGTEQRGALILIDPTTGHRTELSDFDNPEQGDAGSNGELGGISGVVVEKSGTILVGSQRTNDQLTSVYRVNSETGQRALLSDSSDLAQGTPIKYGLDIAVVPRIRDRERDDCYRERHGRYRDRHD